jgi:hypothetical protein
VDILFGLDALAILRRMLDHSEYERALDAVLVALILIADADIFLNCLAAKFLPADVETLLLAMINDKRADAYKAIRLASLRGKADRIINIDVQRTNKGGATAGKGLDGLKRTSALETKGGPLEAVGAIPTISEDYLRKVPPRRRDWAKSVGLFHETDITPRGQALLNAFASEGCKYPDGAFTLWPFEPELARLHLTRKTAPWPTLTFGQMVMLVEGVFSVPIGARNRSATATEGYLRVVFGIYKDLNSQKSLLRNELPLRVAYLVQLGANVGDKISMGIDELAFGSPPRSERVQSRSSRNHEGSLIFRG